MCQPGGQGWGTTDDRNRPDARAEDRGAGEAARARVPLSDHGTWRPAPDRPDPIALLEEQAATRLPDLVPIRYSRMAASPFDFYRGAALPMAADLAPLPRSDIVVQLCGDAHLSNFGLFASPGADQVFDITDFDETLHGPFEWDLKRLAASLVLAGRSRGFSEHEGRHAVHRTSGHTERGWPGSRRCARSTSTTPRWTRARSWASRTSAPDRSCRRPSIRRPTMTPSTSSPS